MQQPPRSCLILGSGMGGLALGALLARAGTDVTILEAHPTLIGGWAHTFAIDGYKFTAGPRYLCNFGPGRIGRRFLEKCALLDRVPLIELDRRGFDHIYIGDAEPIRVPNGWLELAELLKERFPVEARQIQRFFALCLRAFQPIEIMNEHGLYLEPWPKVLWKCIRGCSAATTWFLLHRHFTLHQAFELCGLSSRLRLILNGHGFVFLLPPETLSFYAYVATTLFYHLGCYYPVNDMEGFVGAVVDTIEKHHGRILCNERVVSVTAGRNGVEEVQTQSEERFAADVVVVNFDPKTFVDMIHQSDGASRPQMPKYGYSGSIQSLFLGIKESRILKPRFGKWNLWYHSGAGTGPRRNDGGLIVEPPILYLNSPTLVKGVNNDSPPGHATVTAFAPGHHDALQWASPAVKEGWKQKYTSMLLDMIERRFLSGLRSGLDVVHLDTPQDKEQTLWAPQGNIYGRSFSAQEVWKKLPFKGLLPNLYFVGATISYPGIAAVIQCACKVYEELTGDRV